MAYTAEEEDFLRRNPGDEHRMAQALGGGGSSSSSSSSSSDGDAWHGGGSRDEYDSDTGTTREQRVVDGNYYTPEEWRNRTGGGGGGGGVGGGGGGMGGAYSGYLNTPNPAQDALVQMIKQMQADAASEKARRDAERAALREIMTTRMASAQEPVSTESPGIRELIAARRLESQRGAERSRAALAERLHAQGLGDSGTFDAGVIGLEQDRGESDANAVAEILNDELSEKRQELMQLLSMAASMGDAESARAIQQQLAALDTQMQLTSLSEGGRRFDQDLGFRRSSFMDDLGYRLMALELAANRDATPIFLGGGR